MARRTLAAKYEAYDATQSLQHLILCYNKDAQDIYYDAEPIEEEEEKPAGAWSAPPTIFAPAECTAPQAVVPPASSRPRAAVAAEPVQAGDIV